MKDDRFVGQRVSCFYLYIVEIQIGKLFGCFGTDGPVEGQVKNPAVVGTAARIFDQRGCFSGAGYRVDLDVTPGPDDGLLFVGQLHDWTIY